MSTELSDEALMEAYINGDQGAFEELFKRYSPLLSHIARGYLRRPSDAVDIVQQTFLQLHRARLDYATDRRLRPYLTTICVNLCRESHRRRMRRPEGDPLEDVPVEPTQQLRQESLQARDRVQKALAQLPQGQRDVIMLHWLSDMSFADIAVSLDLNLSAVKVRAHRGYGVLRRVLADED
jgi:RNA polymerase sigma factor (sigma-70 family)